MTEFKITGTKKDPCTPCIVEKELFPLIENHYDDKIKILKLFDKLIVRGGQFGEPHQKYRQHYISPNRIDKINQKLLELELMIFDNADQIEVLSAVEIIQYELRYAVNMELDHIAEQKFTKNR